MADLNQGNEDDDSLSRDLDEGNLIQRNFPMNNTTGCPATQLGQREREVKQ